MEQATLDRMKFDVWAAADDAERRICADAVPGADTLGIAVAREIGRMLWGDPFGIHRRPDGRIELCPIGGGGVADTPIRGETLEVVIEIGVGRLAAQGRSLPRA